MPIDVNTPLKHFVYLSSTNSRPLWHLSIQVSWICPDKMLSVSTDTGNNERASERPAGSVVLFH